MKNNKLKQMKMTMLLKLNCKEVKKCKKLLKKVLNNLIL